MTKEEYDGFIIKINSLKESSDFLELIYLYKDLLDVLILSRDELYNNKNQILEGITEQEFNQEKLDNYTDIIYMSDLINIIILNSKNLPDYVLYSTYHETIH